ncbi:MAG: tetratricopeptide (TPR) repeat protein [Bradymonadia bacterium]
MSRAWNIIAIVLGASACGGPTPKADVQPNETPISKPKPAPEAREPESAAPQAPPSDATDPAETEEPTMTPAQEAGLDRLAEGRRAVADGELETAAARFNDALSADPQLADAQYNLGVLAEWRGDKRGARREYDAALSIDPEFEPAVTAIANMILRTKDLNGALAYTQQQLARKPQSLALRNAVNRVQLQFAGRGAQVIADTKKILRADEKNVPAMLNLAEAYYQQGKHELAIAILGNAKVLAPQNPEIRARAALAHQALGEDLRARMVLEEAVALPGGATAEVHNNLGLVYHAAGDYQGAAEQYEFALARWPDMIAAQINLGNSLKGQQRYTDAVKALLKALKLDPNSPDAYFNLGILYLDGDIPAIDPQRRFEKAVTYFERYKTLRRGKVTEDPVDEYIAEAQRRIEVEKKRAAQARRQPKAPDDEGEEDDAGGEAVDDAAADDVSGEDIDEDAAEEDSE